MNRIDTLDVTSMSRNTRFLELANGSSCKETIQEGVCKHTVGRVSPTDHSNAKLSRGIRSRLP
jgi:hypothetical protein